MLDHQQLGSTVGGPIVVGCMIIYSLNGSIAYIFPFQFLKNNFLNMKVNTNKNKNAVIGKYISLDKINSKIVGAFIFS